MASATSAALLLAGVMSYRSAPTVTVYVDGLPPEAAGDKLLWLVGAMRRLRLTGVRLKDEQSNTLSGSD